MDQISGSVTDPFAFLGDTRWVAWRNEQTAPGKYTKIPYNPRSDGKAKANDPKTWGTREQARTRAEALLAIDELPKGVGFMLGKVDETLAVGGVDLDTCRSADGAVAAWANAIVERLGSYTEVSPSGTGVKVFFRYDPADLPALRAAMKREPGEGSGRKWARGTKASDHPPSIELYLDSRYFAVTDERCAGTPPMLRPVEADTLLWLINEAGPALAVADAGERSTQPDESRSAVAFRLGAELRRAGKTFEEMCAVLRADPRTAEWCKEKGDVHGDRELRRIWDKVKPDHEKGDLGASVYEVIHGVICYVRYDPRCRTEVTQCLCNFNAQIDESITIDDGTETTEAWKISGTMRNGTRLPTVTVPKDRTGARWWDTWNDARVEPNYIGRFFDGLKAISEPIPSRTVYSHLGWRKVDNAWVYLHAGGAIGANGRVDGIECAPGGPLSEFVLPPVRDPIAAVTASLALFDLGPIGTLAYAFTYRAPLCEFVPADLSGWFAGPTGVFKTTAMALGQGHWGRAFNYRHLPAGWTSTANALEKLAYQAKDSLLVIDDYAPPPTERGMTELREKAERVLRAQGNQSGRGRMNPDGSLKGAYPPRGLIVGTGEDVPAVASLRARLVIAQVKRGDVSLDKVKEIDRDARKGLLAEAMAGYVQHLARDAETLPAALAAREAELRDVTVGSHARTPSNLASLLVGVEQGLAFAVATGAISQGVAGELRRTAEGHLRTVAVAQEAEIAEEDDVTRFLESVRAALSSGRAHLGHKSVPGVAPADREQISGWRAKDFVGPLNDDEAPLVTWLPQGNLIGWLDGDDLMLDPMPAMGAAMLVVRSLGRTMGLGETALGRRLKEAGKLAKTTKGRNTFQVRAGGGLQRVWLLSAKETLGVDNEADANGVE